MNRVLLPAILLIVALLFGAWWFANKFSCAIAAAPSSTSTMSIIDGGTTSTLSGLHFMTGSSQLNGGANADNKAALQSIADGLKGNPEKTLTVTGNYASSEKNSTSFENLGIARADEYKKLLVGLGAGGSQILLASNLQNSMQTVADKIYNGVNFNFGMKAAVPAGPVVDPNSADFKPLNLRFATNQSELKLTPEIEAYFNGLLSYMKSNPGSKVAVIGHTDNKGALETNMTISRRRATEVATFMKQNGFTTAQILEEFQGPNQPMSTNDTPEGRAQNRRVEIRIK